MVIVNVRLEAPSEAAVREAARLMGIQVSMVKERGDSWHLYGSTAIAPQVVTVSPAPARHPGHRRTPCQLPHRS